MHTNAREKRESLRRSGGWSEHISTHDSMLGSFVSTQEGTRVGKKEYKAGQEMWEAGDEMCVFVCTWTDECVLSVSVYLFMWIAILAWPLYAFGPELDARDKRLHICACMSRITCSIECAPPLSAYHSLCSLISFLSLLNGFLSLSPHHKCSLSPLLFFNTYKTEKAWPGLGHLEAPVKLSPRPGSLPLASCSIVSGPSQLIPCIAIVAGHCLQPPPTPPG